MSRFTRAWLELRAPYDAASRSVALAQRLAAALPSGPRILDLGAGLGANARWLAPHLPHATAWRLVDCDATLLPATDEAQLLDLATELDRIGEADAVTCSALLDLVSSEWLARLVARLDGRPFLAALSVDGRVELDPGDVDDAAVLATFAADQRRDKGFGAPALGPEAPGRLSALLHGAGYSVVSDESDWVLGPADHAMLAAILDGVADVVPDAEGWCARRREQVRTAGLHLRIGHLDVLGLSSVTPAKAEMPEKS